MRPHLHQREAEEVEAFPFRGVFDGGIGGGHADAPDAIIRAGFDKHAISGLEQIGFPHHWLKQDFVTLPSFDGVCPQKNSHLGMTPLWRAMIRDSREMEGALMTVCSR